VLDLFVHRIVGCCSACSYFPIVHGARLRWGFRACADKTSYSMQCGVQVLAWVGFSLMTQVFAAYVFALVGFLQMTQWALDKYRGYKKTDPGYAKARRAIIPFLL
jgi:hypothetical protein